MRSSAHRPDGPGQLGESTDGRRTFPVGPGCPARYDTHGAIPLGVKGFAQGGTASHAAGHRIRTVGCWLAPGGSFFVPQYRPMSIRSPQWGCGEFRASNGRTFASRSSMWRPVPRDGSVGRGAARRPGRGARRRPRRGGSGEGRGRSLPNPATMPRPAVANPQPARPIFRAGRLPERAYAGSLRRPGWPPWLGRITSDGDHAREGPAVRAGCDSPARIDVVLRDGRLVGA